MLAIPRSTFGSDSSGKLLRALIRSPGPNFEAQPAQRTLSVSRGSFFLVIGPPSLVGARHALPLLRVVHAILALLAVRTQKRDVIARPYTIGTR